MIYIHYHNFLSKKNALILLIYCKIRAGEF